MTTDIRVGQVRFGYYRAALGIGDCAPRLSWRVESAPDGWRQAAYEVAVDSACYLAQSPESVFVPWPAPPLRSRDRRAVRVRVTGADGRTSPWSGPATVEAGLLDAADWGARMITPLDGPAPLVRKGFQLDAPVSSARLYITAHGLYRAEVNGQPVGDDAFAPGWTSYHHRLRYQTYDVTGLLRHGGNALGAQLADGWFRGRLTFARRKRNVYGDRLGLLAQLEVILADGRTVIIGTDASWRSAMAGPYQLLTQQDCPSWLYPVTRGATTIWERWDSMLPDGSINPGEMTSFNHCALGAVADWMHRVLGGLAPGAPGYQVINVAPRPGGGVAWARTAHLTPYGQAEVSWRRADGNLTVDVTVPVGATAVVILPGSDPAEVSSGRHEFSTAHHAPADDPVWRPPFIPTDFD